MTIRGGFMGRMQAEEESFRFSQLSRGALRLLWEYLRPHRRQLALALLAMLVITGAALLTPYLTKVAIDAYIVPGNLRGLTVIAVLYLAVSGVQWLFFIKKTPDLF